MPKTIFQDGTPVEPDFLNSINNPTFSENPQEDGEIPFPPKEGNPFVDIPKSRFFNSNLCLTDLSGLASIDLSSGVGALPTSKLRPSGLRISSDTTSGAYWAIAAGDPLKGAWVWPVNSTQFNVGEVLEFYIGADDVDLGSNYGLRNGAIPQETFYISTQATITHGGGGGIFQAELDDGLFDDLVSQGLAEVVYKTAPQSLSGGESAFFQYILKVNLDGLYYSSPLCSPKLRFTCTTAGTPEIQTKNLGVFLENTKGRVVPILQGFSGGSLLVGSPEQSLNEQRELSYYEAGSVVDLKPAYIGRTSQVGDLLRISKIFVPFKKKKVSPLGNLTITNAALSFYFMDGTGLLAVSPSVAVLEINREGFFVRLNGPEVLTAPFDFSDAITAEISFDWSYIYEA